MKRYTLFVVLILLSVLLDACAPAVPAIDPESAIATIVAGTVAVLPTSTPWPTFTPSPVPTATRSGDVPTEAAVLFDTPTPLPSLTPMIRVETPMFGATPGSSGQLLGLPGAAEYACKEILVKPLWEEKMYPRESFQMVWKVQNVGTEIWYVKQVEYFFMGGDKIYKDEPVRDIAYSVYPNEFIRMRVNMIAPQLEGVYDTIWGLRGPKGNICTVSVRIRVVRTK